MSLFLYHRLFGHLAFDAQHGTAQGPDQQDGAQKLSAVDSKDYAALLKDAEVLGHGTK